MALNQLADFVADAVVATDADLKITYWNAAASALSGWRADEMIGLHAAEALGASFLGSSIEEAVRQTRETGTWNGTVQTQTKDGRTRTSEIAVAALPDGQGYVVIGRDVTDRQKLVDERREIEARLTDAEGFNTSLLAAAPVGILTYRTAGPCISCNTAGAAIVGGTAAELQRQNFRTLESWKRCGLLHLAESVIETGTPVSAQVKLVTTYGRDAWLMVRFTLFHTRNEDILLLVMLDITDVKRVEEELRDTERVLRASQVALTKLSRVIEQSPTSVIITDRSGHIEYVNPGFSVMSGYSADDVIGRNPRVLQSGDTADDVYRDMWATISGGGTWRGELQNKARNGERYWLRATVSPIFDDQGGIAHFVAIQEPIGAQKAAEAAAEEAEQRFIRAQKMEAVGQLAGGIAHDFNNLLTAILGYSDLVLEAVKGDAVLTQDVGEIKRAGERAAELTRQLLAFGRKQRIELQDVNLNRVVEELVRMVGRVIGEHIELAVAADESLGLARLDGGQTEQVLMNLVVNARDAMPAGGRLSIRTANVDIDEASRAHPGLPIGSYVALTVSDTGTGMSPEVQARIFEPFFTTKPPGQGTGLGLATVYGIVKQCNGYLSVDSQLGTGTTFTVYFPRLTTSTMPEEVEAPIAPSLKGHETILVAEDEAGPRHLAQRVLQQHGYTVLVASDGAEALALEAGHRAAIDLLLSDVVMPTTRGPELAERLVRRRPLMKVLYMSGIERYPADSPEATTAEAPFLSKPFTPDALARKVREVLNQPLVYQAVRPAHR